MQLLNNNENHQKLTFTGERFTPEVSGNILLEHLHRYTQACELVSGKDVLDIACGEGYGSAMLATHAATVIGVDISQETIDHASSRYKKDNLSYLRGNCAAIPLSAHTVDIVISFETIEHHDQHEEMMREIKRILRPGGLLLISSPDKHNYSDIPGFHNPFHVKELYEEEFKDLLSRYFKNTHCFGQRIVYGSAIFSDRSPVMISNYTTTKGQVEHAIGITHPTYWIALASDAELPDISFGIFDQPMDESEITVIWKNLVAERDWKINKLEEAASEYQQVIAHRDKDIKTLYDEIVKRDKTITELRDRELIIQASSNSFQLEANELKEQLEEIFDSNSWRMIKSLQSITRLLRAPSKRNK